MFMNLSGYMYSVVKSTAWQIRILSSMMMKTLELETCVTLWLHCDVSLVDIVVSSDCFL